MSALSNVQASFPGVTRVVDAKKDTAFEVTKADTKSAAVRNHTACAAAVACKRKLELDGVIMSVNTAYLIKGNTATRYKVPESVGREITAFDRDAVFEPGDYQLKAPCQSERLGVSRGKSPDTSGPNSHNGNLAKRFRHKTGGIRASIGSRDVV